MPNIELLDLALAAIDAHPESHDQAQYGVRNACGTAGCLVYHVAIVDQAEIQWSRPPINDDGNGFQMIQTINGDDPHDYGRQALDLNMWQAQALFWPFNTVDGLKALRDQLAANPDDVLPIR